MQEAVKSQELISQLDLTKVAALQQKRTLAFVNHFVVTTVQFLNAFMKKSEQKLMQFERKLEKVEAALVLLETRLSSIPEINTSTNIKPVQNTEIESVQRTDEVETEATTTEPTADSDVSQGNVDPPVAEEKPNPEYQRFVKMVQVGVPLEAVKLKVSLEGLDPQVFENIVKK